MIKNILNFEGAESLSRRQQSSIFGGVDRCCLFPPPHGITEDLEGPGSRNNCDSAACKDAACCKNKN